MGVPCRPRTRFEGHQRAHGTARLGGIEQRIDPDILGEIFARSLGRWPRTASTDFYFSPPRSRILLLGLKIGEYDYCDYAVKIECGYEDYS
jgi:hypothetical protein